MFERGVGEEVARALRAPVSRTASQIIGLREIAELPRNEAVAAIVLSHTPIRRLPAQVVAPDSRQSSSFGRPPDPGDRGRDSRREPRALNPETASLRCRRFAICEMAWARQRLSARRAGRGRRAARGGSRPRLCDYHFGSARTASSR
jgi:hypothetical protein